MRTGIRRKVTALFTVGALALAGSGPITAEAAYVDMERANWASFAEDYGGLWDEAMTDYQESGTSSGELTLEFGDFVRMMLSSIFAAEDEESLDFSWLESIGLRAAASKEENSVFRTAIGLCLNDTVLATLEMPVDLGNDAVRFRVPEINGNYLGAPFEFETEEERQQWQRLKEVMNPEFLAELSADGDEVAELLKRYGDILFDSMTDVGSEEKTEKMADIEQTFTVEEGRLYADALEPALLEMAKQARDDEQLKEMIENLGTFSQEENIYEEYQQAMDEAIRDMESEIRESETNGEDNYISLKLWLDADGECAGREFAFVADGEAEEQFAWLNLREGDQAALRMYFITDAWENDGSAVLSGVGTITDGRLNGEYMVTGNGLPQCTIEVSDYDVNAEAGDLDSTYKLTYAGESDDSSDQFPLEDFALILDVEKRAQEKIDNVSLSLTMDDELLAALHLKSGGSEELLSGNDAGGEKVYQADSQEDLEEYVAEVDPEAIFENCRKAGVPEDFIAQIAGLVTQMMQPERADSPETPETSEISENTETPETPEFSEAPEVLEASEIS